MKKTIAAALFAILGAGTIGVGALDDVQLRGAERLRDLTLDLLAICPGADPAGAAGLVYVGIGVGTGADPSFTSTENAEVALLNTGIPNSSTQTGVNKPGGCSDGSDPDTMLECQTVAPMTRFLSAGATCAFPELPTGGTKSAATAEGISFALDGIVIVGAPNQTACNDDPALSGADPEDCDAATGASAGLAYARVLTVLDENTTPGIQCPKCAGPAGNQYLLGQADANNGWKDILRIVYTGLTLADPIVGYGFDVTRDCDGDLRHTIVNHWGDLFQNDCSGGSCTQLRHAFRRDNFSPTTETFLSLIGAPRIGFVDDVVERSPFCDTVGNGDGWSGHEGAVSHYLDTESTACCTASASCAAPVNCAATGLTCLADGFCGVTQSFPGGSIPARPHGPTWIGGFAGYNGDFQDNDPIRRTCVGTYDLNSSGTEPAVAPVEQVCRARRAKIAGTNTFESGATLGLVLPINPPALPVAQAYPTKPCRLGSFSAQGPAPLTTVAPNDPEYPSATRSIIKVDRCPNGDIPQFLTPASGKCLVPLAVDGDPACINGRNNLPGFSVDSPQLAGGVNPIDTTDLIDPVKTTITGGANGLWAGDGRVYNLHLYYLDSTDGKIKYRTVRRRNGDVPIVGAFYRIHTTRTLNGSGSGACRESVSSGVSQDVAASQQIGCLVQASPCSIGYGNRVAADTLPIGTALPFKVNKLEATKACIRKLINGGTPYPLSRQVFLNTMTGFEKVTGQELELAKCFAGAPIGGLSALEALLSDYNLVSRGDAGDPKRSPACVDFQQQAASNCNQPLATATACTTNAQCSFGYSCNLSTLVCEAVNDACTNNPPGIPNDDPAVP